MVCPKKKKKDFFEPWAWVKGQDELLIQSVTELIVILHMGNAHASHNLNTMYMDSLLMGLVISVNKLVINFWIDSVFNEVMLLYYKSSVTQECYFSTTDSDLTPFQHILLL